MITPGPWKWAGVTHDGTGASPDRKTGRGFYQVGGHDGKTICTLTDQPTGNAQLIAASPDLLQACKKAECPHWVHNAGITTDIEALRKIALFYADWNNNVLLPAIAKAEETNLSPA